MKKLYLGIMACAALLAAPQVMAVEPGNANIYASGLKVLNGGEEIQFVLNAPGSVTINFYNGTEKVHTLSQENLEKGTHTLSLAEVFPETVVPGTELTWEVVATGEEKTAINGFSTYASKVAELSNGGNVSAEIWANAGATVADDQKMEFPYSIAVDKNPSSPNFGNIYVLNDGGQSYGSIERASGLYVYDSNLKLLNTTPYTDGLDIASEYYSDVLKVPVSPYAVAVDEDGNVFISGGSAENGGIYVAEASDLSKFTKIISTPSGMTFQDLVVVGKGENKTLWVLNKNNSSLYKSVIGLMSLTDYTLEHVCSLVTASDYVTSANAANPFTTYPARLCSDRNGGFWVITGNNQTNNFGYFWLNHVNANGVLDCGGGDYWGYLLNNDTSELTQYFSLAKKSYDIEMSNDGLQLYVAIMGSIASFPINGSGTITAIKNDGSGVILGGTSSKTITTEYSRNGGSLHPVTTGIAVDAAGNLLATDLSGYFQAFAPVKDDNSYTTPANEAITVSEGLVTGIESVVKDANAPAEYFNMQGVKVNAHENGIFIKRQGNKVSKVVL